MDTKRFYITTPIYYVNDVPHIGHAYTTIAADVAARFKRLAGYDVFFLTGTDEHGVNIERVAQQHGVSPQEWCDRVAAEFKKLWALLNISNDDFIRTTEPRHEKVVAALFQRLYETGDIYRGKYEGWYCTSCEQFYADAEQGPDRTCRIHTGKKLEWTSEDTYLFRLSKYQDWWLRDIEAHPERVEPSERRNEVVAFVRSGLKDLSVSRSTFTWGIPVPFDPRHVIYVWIDALTNYISALGYLDTPEKFRRYWPADIHLVGKEIARFHAVYWPILLHAAGIEVPRQTFAHGWLTFGGQRFSKSLGVVIDPAALSREVASESGAEVGVAVDALRYFLLREIPFGTDGDFSKPALLHRFNADLANDYGNLLNRTLPQLARQFGGQVPAPGPGAGKDSALQQVAREVVAAVEPRIDRLDFKGALEQIWRLLGTANKYIDEEAPWQTVRTDPARAGTVLYNTLEAVRIATILLTPWLPTATARVWDQLGITAPLANQRLADAARWGGLPSGTQVRPGAPIFPRIETKVPAAVRPERSRATRTDAATGGEQTVSTISIDEFKKLDMRVGEIRSATRVPGTDKLIQVQVDLGSEVRTVVAGLVPQYQPDELVGKRVIVVANLEPRRMRGIASQGMLLAAEWDGQVALLTVEKNAPQGAKIS